MPKKVCALDSDTRTGRMQSKSRRTIAQNCLLISAVIVDEDVVHLAEALVDRRATVWDGAWCALATADRHLNTLRQHSILFSAEQTEYRSMHPEDRRKVLGGCQWSDDGRLQEAAGRVLVEVWSKGA